MMDITMMESKVNELKKLRALRDNLDKQIEDIESLIKSDMTAQDKYEFSGEGWSVSWKMVSSNRFDQGTFSADHPKLFEKYKKLTESRRFNVK